VRLFAFSGVSASRRGGIAAWGASRIPMSWVSCSVLLRILTADRSQRSAVDINCHSMLSSSMLMYQRPHSMLSSSMLMYQRPGHSNGHALKFNANASRSRLSSHGCSFPTERSRYKSSFNVKSLALCVNLTAGRSQRSAVDISHSILSTGQ